MLDQQIVELYLRRDEDAIARTEEKYASLLFTVSNQILSDPEDSRECVNDTFLAAWNSIPPHFPNNLGAYLCKITRQLSIDVFRRRSAAKRQGSQYILSLEELGDSFPGSLTPEQILDAKLLGEAVNRFIRALPQRSQIVFLRRYFFFDSLRDIASTCGMKESTVKTLLYRTRQDLKTYLKQEGFDI